MSETPEIAMESPVAQTRSPPGPPGTSQPENTGQNESQPSNAPGTSQPSNNTNPDSNVNSGASAGAVNPEDDIPTANGTDVPTATGTGIGNANATDAAAIQAQQAVIEEERKQYQQQEEGLENLRKEQNQKATISAPKILAEFSKAEFEEGSIFRTKTDNLKQFSKIRECRRDGNCFYRSYLFGIYCGKGYILVHKI
jgi:hypothetical protein